MCCTPVCFVLTTAMLLSLALKMNTLLLPGGRLNALFSVLEPLIYLLSGFMRIFGVWRMISIIFSQDGIQNFFAQTKTIMFL